MPPYPGQPRDPNPAIPQRAPRGGPKAPKKPSVPVAYFVMSFAVLCVAGYFAVQSIITAVGMPDRMAESKFNLVAGSLGAMFLLTYVIVSFCLVLHNQAKIRKALMDRDGVPR
jgi:formate hydrogenlyase subunit 3/multisubunit Na+/H+ antiporter MnhD subunit